MSPACMYRRARRLLMNPPGGRLLLTVPRTLAFVTDAAMRGARHPVYPEPPAPRPTPALALQVAMDEFILAALKSPSRYPHRVDYHRVGEEVMRGVALFEANGWIDDPRSYHRDPPSLVAADVTVEPGRTRGLSYERVSFPSGYEPWPDEPGRERWLDFEANHTAYAWVLRHPDDLPRPWLICVHGFGTGSPMMDFPGFRAGYLHSELGLNVAFPVLPLHGPRKAGRWSGTELMSFDMLNGVHGMAQATWDIRRLVGWLRQGTEATEGAAVTEATAADVPVGLYGLSLGAYTVALTASVAAGFDLVIAGIPATDLPALFAHHCPPALRRRAVENHLLGEETHRLHRVVSPLAMAPQVPRNGRYIFAGLGDRMSTPKQAYRLWQHWGQPRLAWYGGNHVGFFWSKEADRFVRQSLAESGFAGPLTPAA